MNKVIVVIAITLLGGCARESLRSDHGYSVRHNVAVQAFNPNAPDKDLRGMDGAKAEAAYQNYLKDDGKMKDEKLVNKISN
ncbi:MAG: hypothetical protein R3354_00295 [Thiohalomonadales bacterium]|nr:hypothetical protein [Thiohalomonadales bacterium]